MLPRKRKIEKRKATNPRRSGLDRREKQIGVRTESRRVVRARLTRQVYYTITAEEARKIEKPHIIEQYDKFGKVIMDAKRQPNYPHELTEYIHPDAVKIKFLDRRRSQRRGSAEYQYYDKKGKLKNFGPKYPAKGRRATDK